VEQSERIASFPHMGNYHVVVKALIKRILNMKVMTPPPITKRTIELGAKHSPEAVCVPFKYNLGNYIESLEKGADILFQAGGGCRFGYYGEVQEQILRDLGYEFEFLSFDASAGSSIIQIYKAFKNLNPEITISKFMQSFLLTMKMLKCMDEVEEYIRKNIGFEAQKGSFEKMQKSFLNELEKVKSLREIKEIHRKYKEKFEKIEIVKPDKPIRVGIVGELYVLMEPFSNYFIEKELAAYGMEVHRFITASHLLTKRKKHNERLAKEASKYIKYHIGADGTETVEKSKMLAEEKFDGLIHVKPFGCMPEVNAMPMLQRISSDYKIPVLYFSFDSQTSETGIKTRLEAFHDMLTMKRGEKK